MVGTMPQMLMSWSSSQAPCGWPTWVDPERGVARLAELVVEDQAGAPSECRSLEFLGGQRLLLPAFQAWSVWRYGSTSTVSPSRLGGASWLEQRAVAERAIEAAAVELV
jgi:transcription-repair coupling factor (superfamily II helicase)